jgi:catechol 2,3-dioxygenase-like lactoylglutathione lyase family enzyme
MHSCSLAAIILAAIPLASGLQAAPARPRITGISHIAVYSTNAAASDRYYGEVIGAARLPDPEDARGIRYALSATQFVEVMPLPSDAGIRRLDHIAFNVESAEGLRKFLAAKGWKTPTVVETGRDASRWFFVLDPEGNKVEFVQPPRTPKVPTAPNVIGRHIIHLGILVHSRAAEDSFYRDLLGFRPYWFGGRTDGSIDYVSQQTPDSRDWLEYMLVGDPAGVGIPANVTQQQLGSLDHLSIGEVSVEAAYKILADGHRLSGRHDPQPHFGRDGKEQFNLFDPDGTRIELMNFHGTNPPCCSPRTAPDPEE